MYLVYICEVLWPPCYPFQKFKKRQGSRIDGRGDHHDDGDGEGDDVDKDKEDKEELNDVDELIEHE